MRPTTVYPKLLLLLFLIFYGCLKPRLIEVKTVEVKDITSTTATVTGEVTSLGEGISEYGHCWSTSSNPTYESNLGRTTFGTAENTRTFTSTLEYLNRDTRYYVCAYAICDDEPIRYGETFSFDTNAKPSIVHDRSYGGSEEDWASAMIQTSDGGYVIAGKSRSTDVDITNPRGSNDFWVVKLDSSFEIEWQRSLGGSDADWARSIIQSSDGGYVVAGSTESDDWDLDDNFCSSDAWLVKLSPNGNTQWKKSFCAYGGGDNDQLNCVVQTNDGGYAIVGQIGNYSMAKLYEGGGWSWGESGYPERSITQASDGSYVLAGWGSVVKLNVNGGFLWEETFYEGNARSVIETTDGNFVFGGTIEEDFWIGKIDPSGNTLWEKLYGGSGLDDGYAIIHTLDGGYALAGYSWSTDGNISNHHGGEWAEDYWIIKVNAEGELEWENSLGGTDQDRAFGIAQTAAGEYVIGGIVMSDDGNVSTHLGGCCDYWVVMLK